MTWLILENWKNLPSVDVALGPRVFLVGPNASGKSNLLDAIRFLRDVVVEGGLQDFRSAGSTFGLSRESAPPTPARADGTDRGAWTRP